MTNDPTAAVPAPAKTGKKKQIIAGIITLITLVFVFGVVFPQFADYSEAWDAVQEMSSTALVFLVVATVILIIVYVWPYQAALPGLKYGPGFVVRQTSFLISNVIPAGGAFGLAIQYSMLSSYRYGAAETTAAIGITSTWNTFVTLSLPVIGAVALVIIGQGTSQAYALAGIGLLAIVGIVALFVAIFWSESSARRIGRFADRIVGWAYGLFKKEPSLDVAEWVVDFRNSTVDVIKDRWLRITATNYFQQFMQFLILWAAVYAIQGGSTVPVTFVEALVAYSFGRLASFIPVTPGGLGTVDAAITAILVAFGAVNSDALAAVMVWRALTYFPQVFIGAGTFLVWRRKQNKAA
ncbi:MAG: lysylphosphatidylglycerol synthase transmembrane domain-containing protein [Acidimicrobiia bacterium]